MIWHVLWILINTYDTNKELWEGCSDWGSVVWQQSMTCLWHNPKWRFINILYFWLIPAWLPLSLSSKAVPYSVQCCKYSWAYVQAKDLKINGYIHENWILKQRVDFQTWLCVGTQITTGKLQMTVGRGSDDSWLLGSSKNQQKVITVPPHTNLKALKTYFFLSTSSSKH